jgi:hypothetical protein
MTTAQFSERASSYPAIVSPRAAGGSSSRVSSVIGDSVSSPIVLSLSPVDANSVPDWVQSAVNALVKLSRLHADWDSRGAINPTAKAVIGALRVLARVMSDDIPLPVIAPTVDGGILIEWLRSPLEVTIEVEADGRAWVSYGSAQAEWDGPFVVKERLTREALLHLAGSSRTNA